jgi:septum formation protein
MEPVLKMINNIQKFRIILASRSPRRQQLLKELGLDFDVIVKDYDETIPENLNGEKIAGYLAQAKAATFRGEISDSEIIITADTIVWCNNKVLGKPTDFDDAVRILGEISGNTHEVITGVCLSSSSRERVFTDSTRVTFDRLSPEEIFFYVDRFRPFDKAGAYGIQEWIGIAGCSRIEGSYFNVVGLPVQRLYRELQNFIME